MQWLPIQVCIPFSLFHISLQAFVFKIDTHVALLLLTNRQVRDETWKPGGPPCPHLIDLERIQSNKHETQNLPDEES